MRSTKTGICKTCEKEFTYTGNHTKYCSSECKPKQTHDRVCEICGKKFVAVWWKAKYCSPACQKTGKANTRSEVTVTSGRVCKHCGKEFQGTGSAVYCSQDCRDISAQGKVVKRSVEAVCCVCGADFMAGNKRAKYCSTKCKTSVARRNKICPTCGDSFVVIGGSNKKFCSEVCAAAGKVVPTKLLTCIMCKKEFTFVGNSKAKYCEACRPKARCLDQTRCRAKKGLVTEVGSGGNQAGADNHQWNPDGKYHDLLLRSGYESLAYKKTCFENWDRRCVICGSDEAIHVHHLNGIRNDHAVENLLPLCASHHMILHKRILKHPETAQDYLDGMAELWYQLFSKQL